MNPDPASRNTSARSAGTEVFLAFGASKGDREAFVRLALDELGKGNFIIQKVSPLYETDPVDCEDGVPPFLNGVLRGVWNGSPEDLLDFCPVRPSALGASPLRHLPHLLQRTGL